MNVRELTNRNRKCARPEAPRGGAFLALQAAAGQSGDTRTHFWPTETRTHQPCGCSPNTRMVDVLISDRTESGPKLGRQKRPENTCRNVAQNDCSSQLALRETTDESIPAPQGTKAAQRTTPGKRRAALRRQRRAVRRPAEVVQVSGCGTDRTGSPAEAPTTAGGGRDKASATTLEEPGVWLRSVVNSEM